MSTMNRRGCLALFGASILAFDAPALRAQAKPSDFGLLGRKLQTVTDTDFFVFYRLNEAWREQDGKKRDVVVFKPTNPSFAKLVSVRTTLDASTAITQLELEMARAFIENPEQRIFANDIAKSFLGYALPEKDFPSIRQLVLEVNLRPGQARPAEWPAAPTAGFLVYEGKRPDYDQTLPGCTLRMENVKVLGKDWLRIRYALSAKAPG